MEARVIQFSVRPEFISEVSLYFNKKVKPVLEQQAGFISSQLLINDMTYQCLTITFWEFEQAMNVSNSSYFLNNTLNDLRPYLASRPLVGYYKDAAVIE